jgi:MYXO-CTERM domain-containing protein
MIRALIASSVVAALAGSASAGILAFQANSNSDGPEVRASSTTTIADGRTLDLDGKIGVVLSYDADGEGPGAEILIPTELRIIALTREYSVTPFAGQFIHSWRMDGSVQFLDPTSKNLILSITFANSLFTGQSQRINALGTSATLQGNLATDPALSFATGPGSPLNASDFVVDTDYAFSLSDLRRQTGTGPVNVSATGDFSDAWRAEASFVANGLPVPTPGALALLAVGGLTMVRRRR